MRRGEVLPPAPGLEPGSHHRHQRRIPTLISTRSRRGHGGFRTYESWPTEIWSCMSMYGTHIVEVWRHDAIPGVSPSNCARPSLRKWTSQSHDEAGLLIEVEFTDYWERSSPGLCSTQVFRTDSTLFHVTIQVTQLWLNSASNPLHWLHSDSTQPLTLLHWLNSDVTQPLTYFTDSTQTDRRGRCRRRRPAAARTPRLSVPPGTAWWRSPRRSCSTLCLVSTRPNRTRPEVNGTTASCIILQ